MTVTIQTNMPVNKLSTLVTRVKKLARTGDKHPRGRADREAELQMFRDGLRGYVKGNFPNDDELKPLYDNGGKIVLESESGQTIGYLM